MVRKVTPEQLVAIIEQKRRTVLSEGRRLVREFGEQGAYQVYERVVTLDRIDTSDMLGSVKDDYEQFPDGAKSTYGFLDAPHYTKYQEHGTQKISAMHAVEDADANISVDFQNAIDDMMRREWGN